MTVRASVYQDATNHTDPHAGVTVTDQEWLERFLVLGTASGTYYQQPVEFTAEALAHLQSIWTDTPYNVAVTIREFSVSGRTPKQEPIMLALACGLSMGNGSVARSCALRIFNDVVRTGAHLLMVFAFLRQVFKTSMCRSLRSVFTNWYLRLPIEQTCYQVSKYQSRTVQGLRPVSHSDILRVCHPKPVSPQHNELFGWITTGKLSPWSDLTLLLTIEAIHRSNRYVFHPDLSWEMLPSEMLADSSTWEHLILGGSIPYNALVRNLARLAKFGWFSHGPEDRLQRLVFNTLSNPDAMRRARIHPFNLFVQSMGFYHRTHSEGIAAREVDELLDSLVHQAFMKNVLPSERSIAIGLDISASMWFPSSHIDKLGIPAGLAAAVAAKSLMAANPARTHCWAFSGTVVPMQGLNAEVPYRRINDIMQQYSTHMGRTDPGRLIRRLIDAQLSYDAIVIFTDNETNSGEDPAKALAAYRRTVNPRAKIIIVGFTATNKSIANGPGVLQIAGCDASLIELIEGFIS